MHFPNPFKRFFHKKREEGILLLDLSSDDLSLAVLLSDNASWRFLGKGEARLAKNTIFDYQIRNWEDLLEQASLLLQNVYLQSGTKPKKTLVLLSNSWVLGMGLSVRINRSIQGPITQVELDKLFPKIRKQVSQKAVERLSLQGFTDRERELLNAEVLSYKVDGEKVVSPLDLEGQTLDLSLFFRFLEKEPLSQLLDLLKELNLEAEFFWEKSSFYSLGLSLLERQGLVVSLGQHFTDLSAVFGGGSISPNYSFSLGEVDIRNDPLVYYQAFLLSLKKMGVEHFREGPIYLVSDTGSKMAKALDPIWGESFRPAVTPLLREEVWFKALSRVLGD